MNLEGVRDAELLATRLRTMSGLSRGTFKKAIKELHEDWLYIGFSDTTSKTVHVILIDPHSKRSLDLFEDRQKEADKTEQNKKLANRKHTTTQLLAWAMWIFNNPAPQSRKGEFLFWCPDCRNTRTSKARRVAKPRLSVNLHKGNYGLYHCYDCGTGGGLLAMATKRRGNIFEVMTMLYGIEFEEPTLFAAAQRLLDGPMVLGTKP
jgi:hypothetical protein